MGHFSAFNRPLISDFGTVFEGILGAVRVDQKSADEEAGDEGHGVRGD